MPFSAWLRERFVTINTALEFDQLSEDRRRSLLQDLTAGATLLPPLPKADAAENDVLVEHLRVGMLQAACARHGVGADDPRLAPCHHWMLQAQERWRLAPRFLAAPYLYLNAAQNGWPQTFLRSADERRFIEDNAAGLAVYERGWTIVARIRALGLTHGTVPALLADLAETLDRLVPLHAHLQENLDHDAYFHHVRHYYKAVTVAGVEWTGVNAGDQGWSMALDLALGLAQGREHYLGYVRSRLPYLPPSHRTLVEHELHGAGWLEPLVAGVSASAEAAAVGRAALEVYDALVRATWAHLDLAVAFIDKGPGTSGTEMRFLEETVRMRRDHPLLARLRARVR